MKRWIWNFVRIVVVLAILLLLYRGGQFEPDRLGCALARPELFALAMCLIGCGTLLAVQRWRYLMHIQGIDVGFWLAARLTFVGMFFSAAIPGAVSGDIVKAYYIAKGEANKAALFISVAFDRILGLYTIIMTAAVAAACGFGWYCITGRPAVWASQYLQALFVFVLALFLAMTVFMICSMNRAIRESRVVGVVLQWLPFQRAVRGMYDALCYYGSRPGMTLKAALLSLVCQIPGYAGLLCLARLLEVGELSYLDYIIVLPLSLVINAIPVAPGGLGVGEAGFGALFQLFGSVAGTELAVLYHIIFFILAIGIGGCVYLFSDVSGKPRELGSAPMEEAEDTP